jgi:hypothetical protein
MLDLTDRETIHQIRENVFMQYFLGFSTFTNEEPFSPTLFCTIRSRLNLDVMEKINEVLILHGQREEEELNDSDNSNDSTISELPDTSLAEQTLIDKGEPQNKGDLIMDATVAPQYITFPTDLKLLNAAREKTEEIIDKLYDKEICKGPKPRTYRQIARKEFLNTAKKKAKSYKEIYRSNGSQIRYVARNLRYITTMLESYNKTSGFVKIPLDQTDYLYLETIQKVYEQQKYMHDNRINTVENRIVNLHQPHVRPIVRGKEGKKVEFGSKLQVSMINGFALLDKLSWNNFNEGRCLKDSVEKYKSRFGFYPKNVLADKIYCTRENRAFLKTLDITLKAKPLGRPSNNMALSNQVSPGERNPIEGKFGQGKVAYGLDKIKAKLQCTSESWIASIIFVLNLVNLTRRALVSLLQKIIYKINGNFVRFQMGFSL